MDSPDPQGTPGVNHDGIAGPILTRAETEADLDGWSSSTTELAEGQKDVSTASRLLFLTVEYVEEHAADYGRSAFAGFEPGTPFSLQPPASLSEFEHRVSPLDPNMGSTAHYSPVYTISGHSDSLSVSREISSSSTTVSSNPSSPFPGQVVVLTNPSSPLMNPPSNTLPASPSFTENSHGHSPLSSTVVASPEIAQGFVNHMLSNPVSSPITCTSSSTDGGDGLLRQVVADDGYFNQQASSTTGSVLPGRLRGSPLNPNSPHSPLQAPLTPADNYVVSSSTEALDTMGPRPSDFHSDASVSVANSPGVVDSTSEIMIHSSMQQANEIVSAADTSPFNSLETAGVMSTTHDVQLKHDPLDRVQLLISSSDGSIAYSLDGQTSFMQTRLVDMGNDLAQRTTDEQNLNSVINSFKSQGLVIGEGENGDLQLHPSQVGDASAEEKLAGSLGLREFTLAVRQQQNEILQQSLLAAPLNGDLSDSVAHLSESLLNEAVKISIVDPNLEAVETYSDILMESVGNTIGNEISENSLIQQSPEICSDFNLPNSRTSKISESSHVNSKVTDVKTLRNVANSNTFNDGCCSYFNAEDTKSMLDCALLSLPTCYLTISKLPLNKAKESEYGVFARKTIPKRTQFGPVEGMLMNSEDFMKKDQQGSERNLIFLIETESGQVQTLQLSSDYTSNWMTYVRAASCFKEQNLILNQQGQSLFFTTTKVIHPKQELRVWYSLPYARKHGLPSLLPMKFDTQGCGESLNTWSCFQCNKSFANPVYLQCHLNVHELDKIKEVSDGKSAEKENHNLNQKNVPTFHSKKLKNMRTKCEGCKCECKTCNNDIQQKCSLKKCHASHSRTKKYLCEVCGYQFSQPLVRSCHVRRRLKDTNMNDSSEQVPGFPRTKLHVPRKGISSQDLCCPKCTKREETSDINSVECDISKEIQPSQPTNAQSNSLPEEQILIQSSSHASSNLNDRTDFLETRMETVDVNAEEFLSPEDDHQLNSVLNAFKLGDHKLAGSLDLQDLSLAVQQPQTDLLEQTLLSAPLNGDLTDSVVCFGNYDDVKISIVDPNMETVGSFTDILLEPTCVENTISNEISDSSLPQQTPELNSKYKVTKNTEVDCQTPTIKDKLLQKSKTRKSDSSNNTGFQQVNKSVVAQVSALLPASYLTIRKFSRKIGEESGCGVFARKTIRRRTCFGPIQGFLRMSTFSRESNGQKLKNKLVFLVETGPDKVQALDISRKNAFNWMRFVRVAQSCNEQNMILSQRGQSLFLTTTKVIHPREELRVWYSLVYARRHGLPFLQPLKLGLTGTCDPSSTWLCFKCSDRFVSSGDLQYHLNIHNLDTLKMENNSYVRKATCALCSKKAAYKKKNKDYASKCQTCKSQCCPCHVVQHNDNQKKQKPSRSRSRKYLCEFCGFQFSHSYNRDRHVQRHHNDTNMNGTYNSVPANEKLIKPEKVESKTNSAWYCSHCNQHFRSASVCNLHTLVHAAENVEETEVITGVPNDFPVLPKMPVESDLRCPKCTKKVETSDGASRLECDVSKIIQPSQPASSPSHSHSDKETISSGGSSVTFNLNNQNNFMETRVVGMDTTEFLAHNSADDDHHLNSVLNSLKMQGLVIDEGENGGLQLRPSQTDEICVEDKLGDAIQLQELSLAVQQQERDLLQQTLLGGPLNGDISGSVSHLDQSLLNDDVKMSIVDPSQETVGAYTDILMENTCVENAIAHEITENSLLQKAPEICTNSKQKDKLPEQRTSVGEDKSITSRDLKHCKEVNCLNISSTQEKPVLAIALPSFPSAFLAIRKLPPKKTEKIVYGIFARKILSKRTQFGPIEGIFVKDEDHLGTCEKQHDNSKDLVLSIEMESGDLQKLYVNPGDSWYWMKYIRTATSFKERNLVLNQNGQSLFFMTTKVIHPKQELRVWYSLPYAMKRNLPLLNPDVSIRKNLEVMDKVWPCFECCEKFASSEALQIHLNIHDFEREDEDPLDKRLMRKTNRSFRRKGILNFSPRKYKSSSNKPSEGFPYQCHTCHRAFPRNYNLKRHELLHAKDKKYMCEVCGCQFTHVYNRDRHIRKRHKDLNKNGNSKLSAFLKKKLGLKSNTQSGNKASMEWCCSHCSLGFDSLRVLNIHTLSHGNREFMFDNENLKCPQCCEEFITKKELVDHVAEHGKLLSQARLRGSSNPAKPWKCELCYKSFATEDRLQRHMLVHGAEESKPLQCDICYKRFLNNSALACHIKIHTAEKKMFECPICKMVFEQVLSLKEHVHCHSENGVYTCPQCNKVFDGYSLIRKHIRAFHSDRKHTCNYCGKLFPKLDKLRMHMLRHSDHREFLCANCGKQFKRKDKLKEHMKRMHSAERELRLAMKPHRPPTAKKFMPKVQVSPTDYHRFIYKCHTCLLGFKRRGMLVNHLAKRHPDISPESVPELNLPILKTTRDYYCQYCEKVYKSSSKRKAHILKIHPGAELPMSNRRKGGVPEIPGFPNPTFSQTVGSITTLPHGCPWCHKQYASKAKLLQHQRKKHIDLLPQSQQLTSIDEQEPPLSGTDQQMILPQSEQDTQHQNDSTLTQLQGIENVINIIPGDYHISTTEEDLHEFQESGIIIDTSAMERPLKVLPDGISADLLSQAMSELTNEFRVSVGSSPNDHYLRIVQTSPGHITVTQSPSSPENCDKDALTPSTNTVIGDSDTLSPTSGPNQTSQLHHLLSESYSLPSSPSSSPSPQTWANAHVTFTPYTAR